MTVDPTPSATVTATVAATPTATRTASPRPTASRSATPRPSAGPADPLASTPPLESAAPAVGLPTCAAADLSVADADEVFTSSTVQELFTVRTSGPDCQLQGHPVVRLLDAAGAPVPGTVAQGGPGLPGAAPSPLSLSRTTSLSFFVVTARDGSCLPVAALDVTLPGTGAALRVASSMQVCGEGVAVGPVQRLGDSE